MPHTASTQSPLSRVREALLAVTRIDARQYGAIIATFGRWAGLGALAGVFAGPASAVFLITLRWASAARAQNPWGLALLPLVGILIHILFAKLGGVAARGNNLLIEEVHLNRQPVPLAMIPLGFLAPVITLLCGGSVASVGTAVQMGGALADGLARALRLSKEERRILLMAGLSGGFGSVLGAPIAGAVFGMEVQSVGRIRYEGIVPCLVSSLVAFGVMRALGVSPGQFPAIEAVALEPLLALKVALAAGAFGLCGLAFIEFTRAVSRVLGRAAGRRAWLKPAMGGLAIIFLAVAIGEPGYLGMSEPLLAAAFSGVAMPGLAFLFKLIFTGLTVGAGYRAGEVTPLFVMGATLGAALGPILGVPVPLLAAVGFVSVFAGASNTPLASALLGVELFGAAGLPYLLIGTVVAYVFSGHRSIYITQRVDTPKYIFTIPKRKAVRDVMTPNPATAPPDAPATEILDLLNQRRVKSVIVVEAGHVLGIITAGDLRRRGGLALAADGPRILAARGIRARDVMTADPARVSERASLDEAAQIMSRARLKRLPVVDASERMTGVISRSDILRSLADEAHLRIETPLLGAEEPVGGDRVSGWMRANVTTVEADDTFATVLERLVADPMRRLIVVDDRQRVIGIIIDADVLGWVGGIPDAALRDTVRNWLNGESAGSADAPSSAMDELTAADVMSPTVFTVLDDARPIDVVRRMIDQRVKRLVVVDAENRLRGIVDRHDMLRAMAAGA